jgi:hypothetical protein
MLSGKHDLIRRTSITSTPRSLWTDSIGKFGGNQKSKRKKQMSSYVDV